MPAHAICLPRVPVIPDPPVLRLPPPLPVTATATDCRTIPAPVVPRTPCLPVASTLHARTPPLRRTSLPLPVAGLRCYLTPPFVHCVYTCRCTVGSRILRTCLLVVPRLFGVYAVYLTCRNTAACPPLHTCNRLRTPHYACLHTIPHLPAVPTLTLLPFGRLVTPALPPALPYIVLPRCPGCTTLPFTTDTLPYGFCCYLRGSACGSGWVLPPRYYPRNACRTRLPPPPTLRACPALPAVGLVPTRLIPPLRVALPRSACVGLLPTVYTCLPLPQPGRFWLPRLLRLDCPCLRAPCLLLPEPSYHTRLATAARFDVFLLRLWVYWLLRCPLPARPCYTIPTPAFTTLPHSLLPSALGLRLPYLELF